MRLIGLSGFAQAGKDLAASFLVERGFKRYAFADVLRWSLYNLNPPLIVNNTYIGRVQDVVDDRGWEYAKTEIDEVRQLLQRFGTEVGRAIYGEDFWVDMVMSRLNEKGSYVITDARYPNEVQAIHDRGGKVFRIDRYNGKPANGHASENVHSLIVDGVIPNNGTVEEYKAAVLSAVLGV